MSSSSSNSLNKSNSHSEKQVNKLCTLLNIMNDSISEMHDSIIQIAALLKMLSTRYRHDYQFLPFRKLANTYIQRFVDAAFEVEELCDQLKDDVKQSWQDLQETYCVRKENKDRRNVKKTLKKIAKVIKTFTRELHEYQTEYEVIEASLDPQSKNLYETHLFNAISYTQSNYAKYDFESLLELLQNYIDDGFRYT